MRVNASCDRVAPAACECPAPRRPPPSPVVGRHSPPQSWSRGEEGEAEGVRLPPPLSLFLPPGRPFNPRPHRDKHVQLTDVGILGLSEPLPETVLVPRFPDLYL